MSGYVRPPLAAHWHAISTCDRNGWFSYFQPGSGTAWGTANLAVYIPFPVYERVIVRKLWAGVGTVGTSDMDVGLYDAGGTKLTSSGATAKVTTSTEQVFDVTDVTIGPGRYYLAIVSASATDTFSIAFSPAAPCPAAFGVLTEANALPLPATATWTYDYTLARVNLGGVLIETTVS